MAFSVDHVDVQDAAHLRVWFTAPANVDAVLLDPGHYALAARFGLSEPVSVESVIPGAASTTTYVDLELYDRMTANALYTFNASGLVSATGAKICGSGVSFTAPDTGNHRKTAEIKKLVPRLLNQALGSFVNTLLYVLGESDHKVAGEQSGVSAFQDFEDGLFLDTATGDALSVLGQNAVVTRPASEASDDALYRQLVPLLSWGPKGTLSQIYRLLVAVLGDPTTGADWDFYEINPNEFVVEAKWSAIAGRLNLTSATYVHKDATVDGGVTYLGDYTLTDKNAARTSVGGNAFYVAGNAQSPVIGEVLALARAAGVVIRLTQKGQ